MKGYESYKDSLVDWIGNIPNDWPITKLKFISNVYNGNSLNDDLKEKYESDNLNDIPYISTKDVEQDNGKINLENGIRIPKNEGNFKLAPKGSFVLCIEGANAGKKIGFLNEEAYFVNKLACFDYGNKFLYYYVLSDNFKNQFFNSLSGLIGGVSISIIRNFYSPFPSIEEQTAIASFLDYKTSLIDATIEKKKRLIELLKEKRQAVINEAVTKGLNPNAPMKDSGVEWLGDIPEHWKIRNFDSTATKNQYSFTGGPFGSDLKSEEYTDGGVRIIQLQNIGVGVFKDDYKIYTSEEKAVQLASCLIFPGDIIIAKMADPVARATIIPNTEKKYIMASDGIRLEVDNDFFNTKFVEYSVNSIYFNSQAEAVSTGTTRLRIGLTVLKKLKILAPPIEEQNLIAEKLMIEELKINSIMSKLDIQIQKLQTYRQSLISEAVTGKIDVRDWERTKN